MGEPVGSGVGGAGSSGQPGAAPGDARAQLLLAETGGLGPLYHLRHRLEVLPPVLETEQFLHQVVDALLFQQLDPLVRLGHLGLQDLDALLVPLLVLLQGL